MAEPVVTRVVIFTGSDGDYYLRAIAANGEPVAHGEGYRHRADAVAMAARLFPAAVIEDETAA